MKWQEIIFEYVCPSMGCLLAAAVFAAPINDLKQALRRGSLGSLNTVPWCVMTGNCLGWCAYAYYTSDPFVLASNLPGLILSLWLNIGACKLQYLGQIDAIRGSNADDVAVGEETHEGRLERKRSPKSEPTYNTSISVSLTSSPQDALLLKVLCGWAFVLVCVGWFDVVLERIDFQPYEPQTVVGVLVNINLVFFYGAPLQTMKLVLESKSSDSIHTPTVTRNLVNAIFWMSYGMARKDLIIYGPNGVGFLLGLAQCALCCLYPKGSKDQSRGEETVEFSSVPLTDDDTETPSIPPINHRSSLSTAGRRIV